MVVIATKKMGRPTDNPKNNQFRIRMSDDDVRKLQFCSEHLNLTKAEIIRMGIDMVYQEIKKQ